MPRSLRFLATALAVTLLAACAGHVSPPKSGPGAPAAAVAVDRFLQLAGAKDYVQMGWVFGTEAGPVIARDALPDVERRMYALATVLENDTYVVGTGAPVPGRIGRAEVFTVRLVHGTRSYAVPFTRRARVGPALVRGEGGHRGDHRRALAAGGARPAGRAPPALRCCCAGAGRRPGGRGRPVGAAASMSW